jgi:hypothetical protein
VKVYIEVVRFGDLVRSLWFGLTAGDDGRRGRLGNGLSVQSDDIRQTPRVVPGRPT